MKTVLPQIISRTQHAFIRNRNINSCIRFIYDTLVFTEQENIPGILLSIDFEKAFDSISWTFLFKALNLFNFGPCFIKWIRTFYSDITTCISVNGQFSEWFDIKRGVRQGDPSSPYLYLLCAEVLTLMIVSNEKIKGIKVNNNTNVLAQFADDTTLSLDGSEESLVEALNTIKHFGKISGLKVNEQKTLIIWIGSMKGSDIRYLRDDNYVWDPGTSFKIIGIKFSVHTKNIVKLNYEDKLQEIKRALYKWKRRKLTPLGKIAIIKTMIISKITHLMLNIPDPNESFIKEVEKVIFKYLWDDKPPKVSKTTICSEYSEGGLRMVNLRNFLMALKISWLRKIQYDREMREMATNICPDLANIHVFGSDFCKLVLGKTKNLFWKDVLTHLLHFHNKCKSKTLEDLMNEHLFYNENILRDKRSIYLKEWVDHDIVYIHQIHKPTGELLTFHEFKTKYPWCQTNFLIFQGIINAIKQYKNRFNTQFFDENYRLGNKAWSNILKGNKYIQIVMNVSDTNPAAVNKWDSKFENINWSKTFNLTYKVTQDVKLRWFQYRLIHRLLPTQRYLYIRKIVEDPICNLCQQEEQDIEHLFFDCEVIKSFWHDLQDLLKNQCPHCENIRFIKELILFGNAPNYFTDDIFLFIILYAKYYIYICKLDDRLPTINTFLKTLKSRYNIEKYIAVTRNKTDTFNSNWQLYRNLIRN